MVNLVNHQEEPDVPSQNHSLIQVRLGESGIRTRLNLNKTFAKKQLKQQQSDKLLPLLLNTEW